MSHVLRNTHVAMLNLGVKGHSTNSIFLVLTPVLLKPDTGCFTRYNDKKHTQKDKL